ncbi:MAG: metallophosphoesterase [Clostridiales bacterium]|nr:metallophosphoesterase [Clostridiales bacterium]
MKTFIILSDTHGNITAIRRLKEIIGETDFVIHLGDHKSDIKEIALQYPQKVHAVNGNCDGGKAEEEILEVEGFRILLTHGHKYSVKQGLTNLNLYMQENNIDIALYGHTHEARVESYNGKHFINPGCMTRYGDMSYCYMVLHNGTITTKIVNIF